MLLFVVGKVEGRVMAARTSLILAETAPRINTLCLTENTLCLTENILCLTENILCLTENTLCLTENILEYPMFD